MALSTEQARELVGLLTRLTESYNVDPSDIEPAALACALKSTPSEMGEALARVVRMAATNRQLRAVKLPPLLLHDEDGQATDDAQIANAVQMRRGLSSEEKAAVDAVGISVAQYEQSIRGSYGTVLGLKLNEQAFKKALATCRTQKAQKQAGDEFASLELLRARLRSLAKPRQLKAGPTLE
jgi:hypothetical protein